MLDYYEITGPRRALLLGLAEDAAQKGWWEEFGDSLTDEYQQFIGLEYEATSMSIWHVDVVTGLLQTEAYARHIISSYSRVEPVPPGMVGRMVNVRMRRQQALERDGLQLAVVLDESVLQRRVGNDSVMFEQLQRLAHEAEKPNVSLHILPLNAQHTVFGESFVIFGFVADPDAMLQEVVSTEQLEERFHPGGGAGDVPAPHRLPDAGRRRPRSGRVPGPHPGHRRVALERRRPPRQRLSDTVPQPP